MIVIVFRSRPAAAGGADYEAMAAELDALVKNQPGFVDAKTYAAADGEYVTIVHWEDEASLRAWRELPRHREAQQAARARWHDAYHIEVAGVIRSSVFERPQARDD